MRPANMLENALTMPKLIRKDRMTDLETNPKFSSAINGTTVRSNPIMDPTKALTNSRSANWRQLALRPKLIGLEFILPLQPQSPQPASR
jgi:hypothetical protein